MKVFIIYSFNDKDKVLDVVEKLTKGTADTIINMLEMNGRRIWKRKSKKRIKDSNLVIAVHGANSHNSKNIKWEINKAYKLGKRIFAIKLDPNNEFHPALNELYKKEDEFGDDKQIILNMSLADIIKYINCSPDYDYSLFNDVKNEEKRMELLFEQYKLFLDSSESLVSRRQDVNSFYTTVSSAIVAIGAGIVALADDFSWKCIASMLFSAVGIILSRSWIRIIRSYGKLNGCKLKIIGLIEKKLPASMYAAEWKVMTDRLHFKPYVSFTESEVIVPKIFIVVHVLIIICAFTLLLLNACGKFPTAAVQP